MKLINKILVLIGILTFSETKRLGRRKAPTVVKTIKFSIENKDYSSGTGWFRQIINANSPNSTNEEITVKNGNLNLTSGNFKVSDYDDHGNVILVIGMSKETKTFSHDTTLYYKKASEVKKSCDYSVMFTFKNKDKPDLHVTVGLERVIDDIDLLRAAQTVIHKDSFFDRIFKKEEKKECEKRKAD